MSKNYAREVKVKKQLRLRDGENKQVSEYEVWVRYPLQKNCKYRTYLWDRFKLFQFVFVFVPALVNQFSSFIKGSTSVWGQNVIFFCKTKIALSTSMLVWFWPYRWFSMRWLGSNQSPCMPRCISKVQSPCSSPGVWTTARDCSSVLWIRSRTDQSSPWFCRYILRWLCRQYISHGIYWTSGTVSYFCSYKAKLSVSYQVHEVVSHCGLR